MLMNSDKISGRSGTIPSTLHTERSGSVQPTAGFGSAPPWALQQFFNGEIDLDIELSKRFPNMPMMTIIRFRNLGSHSQRRVATLTTQDASAQAVFDGDAASGVVQVAFSYGQMLTMRFILSDLSNLDRRRWLELMQREEGGVAFLWGAARWLEDYLICIVHKYFTKLYAFSPANFEAAIRMSPEVTAQLMQWLADIWSQGDADDAAPDLLTW